MKKDDTHAKNVEPTKEGKLAGDRRSSAKAKTASGHVVRRKPPKADDLFETVIVEAPRNPKRKIVVADKQAPVVEKKKTEAVKNEPAVVKTAPVTPPKNDVKASEKKPALEPERKWPVLPPEAEVLPNRYMPPTGKKRIVMISSECTPYAKSGGLADVVDSLSHALADREHEVSVIMPYYPQQMRDYCAETSLCYEILEVPFGSWSEYARVRCIRPKPNLNFFFIEYNKFFDRAGLYDFNNVEFADNAARYIFFCRAAMECILALRLKPDIIHTHDWHAALCNVYLTLPYYREHPQLIKTRSVLTLHNLGYQGNFDKSNYYLTGLDWSYFTYQCLEFHDRINLLKGGIMTAHRVTTVSPSYAREILGYEQGFGLDASLRHCASLGRLSGILNGINTDEWDPSTDPLIPAHFDSENMDGKIVCKAALQKEFKLEPNPNKPIIGVVSRLAEQKGIDVFLSAIGQIITEYRAQVVILGSGEPGLHCWIDSYARSFPGRFGAWIGYNNKLSHMIEAGSDFFCMPSRYEPCGLNQMYSMRYGTLPVVRATGGLDDTVRHYDPAKPEKSSGFKFMDLTVDAVRNTLYYAIDVYDHNPLSIWLMRQNGMKSNFSWELTAGHYEALYEAARHEAMS